MLIRTIRPQDRPAAGNLAESLNLDYPGMDGDAFWVAEDGGRIAGICGLKRHPDCLELCALGVAEDSRGLGIGGQLVRALLEGTSGDVYLATVIPDFFEKRGFFRTRVFPVSMRKNPEWCEGCETARCAVMVRRGR